MQEIEKSVDEKPNDPSLNKDEVQRKSSQHTSYRSSLKKVFYTDLDRCIGCKSCEVACARVHTGRPLTALQIVGEHPMPMRCHHCEINPCIEVCPKEAIEKNEFGIVIINEMKCVACGLCIVACPFGSIRLDEERKVAVKCDLCWSKIKDGDTPACVLTCPAEAIKFLSCIGCNACTVSCPFAKQYHIIER